MSDNPKSIWRRPWGGWRGAVGWFVILFCAVFFVMFALSLATEKAAMPMGDMVLRSVVAALTSAVALTLLLACIRWLCCWRNFRRFLFGLACLATLIALFYAEENIRGKWAWNRYVKEQAANGEVLDLMQLAPPPIPDEQNFFMTPYWDSMHFSVTNGRTVWASDRSKIAKFDIPGQGLRTPRFASASWTVGERVDLSELQAFYRGSNDVYSSSEGTFTNYFPVSPEPQSPAEDILLALSWFDEDRQLLIESCSRPQARFWIKYQDGYEALMPHLRVLAMTEDYLSLHAIAALRTGDSATALEDILLSFRAMEAVRNEPFAISHLVRIGRLGTMLQPIWEGLVDHRWSEVQLEAMEAWLAQIDFLAEYQLSVRGERASGIWAVDSAEKNRKWGLQFLLLTDSHLSEEDAFDKSLAGILIRLSPKGWFDQNKLTLCRLCSNYLLPSADRYHGIIEPAVAERCAKMSYYDPQSHPTPFNLAARTLLPSLGRSAFKFAYAQATWDLARVACALERYRLAKGVFPESLDSLTPAFLTTIPHDVINGYPLNYRRISDDHFVLYSVGWNGVDDGGVVPHANKGHYPDREQGDWVWQLPDPKRQPN